MPETEITPIAGGMDGVDIVPGIIAAQLTMFFSAEVDKQYIITVINNGAGDVLLTILGEKPNNYGNYKDHSGTVTAGNTFVFSGYYYGDYRMDANEKFHLTFDDVTDVSIVVVETD